MARCVVKVVALADRSTGVGKNSGKAYDFTEAAFSFKNQWGQNAVAVASIDGAVMDELSVHEGGKYDASVMRSDNGRYYIDLFGEV